MEAIDDYANENIARSLAYTVLEQRQQHNFAALVPMASKLLAHRVRFLGTATGPSSVEEWSSVIQWQSDDCQKVIETEWNLQDQLYRNPVYYKRLDAETLHCMVEFAAVHRRRYAIVLTLEEGASDISELKYHNTKAFSEDEWRNTVATTWSESLEHAERDFMIPASPEPVESGNGHEAPDGYWGDWSSDEGEGGGPDEGELQIKGSSSGRRRGGAGKDRSAGAAGQGENEDEEEQDSEEEYYARWSKDPGTLTPGPGEDAGDKAPPPREAGPARTLQSYKVFQSLADTERQEMQEEYDNSFNPLHIVPSVPDLMDMHSSALHELTQMLHETLPANSSSTTTSTTSTTGKTIDPLPKVVRSRENSTSDHQHLPGAFPTTTSAPAAQHASYGHEAGRMFLEKSLRALVGVARLVGFQDIDILDTVKRILNDDKPPS